MINTINNQTKRRVLLAMVLCMGMSNAFAGTLAIAPPPAPLCAVHYQQHGTYREIGKQQGHFPYLSGEGKQLDLSWVMKNTVPRGWAVIYTQGAPLHLSVTLKGQYTWTGRLRYIAHRYPLNITVNFTHRTVTVKQGAITP